jgi:hypothetical protein
MPYFVPSPETHPKHLKPTQYSSASYQCLRDPTAFRLGGAPHRTGISHRKGKIDVIPTIYRRSP